MTTAIVTPLNPYEQALRAIIDGTGLKSDTEVEALHRTAIDQAKQHYGLVSTDDATGIVRRDLEEIESARARA